LKQILILELFLQETELKIWCSVWTEMLWLSIGVGMLWTR